MLSTVSYCRNIWIKLNIEYVDKCLHTKTRIKNNESVERHNYRDTNERTKNIVFRIRPTRDESFLLQFFFNGGLFFSVAP